MPQSAPHLVRITVSASADTGPATPSASKWELLRKAKSLLPENGRFHACNHAAKKRAHGVQVFTQGGGAWLGGTYQCGSVWICPVCARRVAEIRRRELQTGINNAIRRGWGVALVTLTFPHGAGDVLADILDKFTAAQRDFKSGRAAAALRQGIGFVGEIKTLEVTHGENGFHPHTHSIWISERQLTDADALILQGHLYDLWLHACQKRGLPAPSREHGVDVRVARHDVAEYVAKWGFAAELAGGVSKLGKTGSRNPWQLLADAVAGDRNAARLWRIFAYAFFGKRQLFWSKRKTGKQKKISIWRKDESTGRMVHDGFKVRDEWVSLRAELELAPELTEQEMLALENDDREDIREVIVLDFDTWHLVRHTESQERLLFFALRDERELKNWLNGLRSSTPMLDGRILGVREDWIT